MKTSPALTSVKGVLVVGASVGVWFAALGFVEHGARPFFTSDAVEFRALANNLSRTSVTLITTVFGCLFFAIPLTANIYSPQIIENFWRGRTNRLVLGLYVFSAANSVWLTSVPAADGNIPTFHLAISFALVMLSLVVLLPFLFSVFRLIDPESIVARVTANVIEIMRPRPGAVPYVPSDVIAEHVGEDAMDETTRGSRRRTGHIPLHALDTAVATDVVLQERMERRINELGAVLLRTLERGEREFAVDAVGGVVAAGRHWLQLKPLFGPELLVVDSRRLHGFSPSAIRLVNADRTWVDLMLLQQLARGFSTALVRAPDVVSAIGRALRHYCIAAAEHRDDGVLRLSLRFMNNAMRDAVKRLDVYAIYDLLFQWSELAAQLWRSRPAAVVEMLRRADQYGRRAADADVVFAHALVAYDFGRVLVAADPKDRGYADLLRAYLATGAGRPDELHRLFVKARLVTAARLGAADRPETAATLLSSLDSVPDAVFHSAADEILGTEDPWFWEVTDRQENLDWLAPEARRWLTRTAAGRKGTRS